LAKLSAFFLPIGFITSFFSVQITELTDSFTARTYWIVLGSVAGLSLIMFFFFGKILMWAIERAEEVPGVARNGLTRLWNKLKPTAYL
jgi:hypothetical protein